MKSQKKQTLSGPPRFQKQLPRLLWLLFPIYFGGLLLFYPGHLSYMESSSLFLFTKDYFYEVALVPGGLAVWIANFLTQFFRYPALGALFLTLVPLAVYATLRLISKPGASRAAVVLAVGIPTLFAAFFFLPKDSSYAVWLQFLLLFACSALYLRIRPAKIRYLFSFVGAPVFFLLLPVFGFVVLYLSFVLTEFFFYKKRDFSAIVSACGWCAVAILLPLWGHYRLFLIPFDTLYYTGRSDLVFLTLPLSLFLLFLPETKRGGSLVLSLLSVGALVALSVNLVRSCHLQVEETILSMVQAAEDQDWDKLQNISDSQTAYNRQMMYLTVVALANKGTLAERLFEYPVAGTSILYLPRAHNYINSSLGGYLYEFVGMPGGGLLYAFDASVITKYEFSFSSLKKMIRLNIEKRDYDMAEKYLTILEQATLYKDWVKEQRRFMRTRPASWEPVEQDLFVSPYRPIQEFEGILQMQPKNERACELLLCSLLLEKEVERFADVFVRYYLPLKKKSIPKHYQEALLVANARNKTLLAGYDFNLNSELVIQFQLFQKIMRSANGNVDLEQKLLDKYAHTWWYYYLYSEPDVTVSADDETVVN